jgi:hypothetical protein
MMMYDREKTVRKIDVGKEEEEADHYEPALKTMNRL